MRFERILITGANGLLGQELVQQLSRQPNYDVLATGNNPGPRFTGASCGYIGLDIRDRDAVRRVFDSFAPTSVINCAAMTEVDRCEDDRDACWTLNARAVAGLARQCNAIGARLVQVSSDFVFDGKDGPYNETARPQPANFYGKAKLGGENAAREAGMGKWAIVRTNVVYGTGEDLPRANFALWVMRQLSCGMPIQVFTDQYRTPTYAFDLAAGIERIVCFGKTGIYNLSGRDLVSMYAFALAVARAFGLDASLINPTTTNKLQQRAPRPLKTGFIILKAQTEIGFKPPSIDEALAHLKRRMAAPAAQI